MHELLCEPSGQSTTVDVCESCEGVFVEFFDGESSAIARELVENRPPRAASVTSSPASVTCPECAIVMHTVSYLGDGPSIERCGGCASLFMKRNELEAMAEYRTRDTNPRGCLDRVLSAIGLR